MRLTGFEKLCEFVDGFHIADFAHIVEIAIHHTELLALENIGCAPAGEQHCANELGKRFSVFLIGIDFGDHARIVMVFNHKRRPRGAVKLQLILCKELL